MWSLPTLSSPPLDQCDYARMSQAEQLDTLQALFPSHSRSLLAKYLAASSYNVERAFAAIERNEAIVEAGGSRKRRRKKVENEGLAGWIRRDKQVKTGEVLILSDSEDDKDPLPSAPATSKSAFDLLKPSRTPATASQPAPTHVNLPPLTVSTPALVAKHTNGLVTLVEDALPPELAARLYVKMVKESVGEGEGDRACQSFPTLPACARLTDFHLSQGRKTSGTSSTEKSLRLILLASTANCRRS